MGLVMAACRQKPVKREPTVLEGKKVDVSSIYKKRSGDLVEALYDELVNGSAELAELESQIKALKKQAPDSLKDYRTFNEKSNAYYGLANKKIGTITDSVVRKKLEHLIYNSRQQFNDSIALLRELDSCINKRTGTINDLHTVLKLVKTLPLIEDFQRNNRPASRPAENALQNLDSLVIRLDSLVNIE
jgi:predicted  nucleic acid-binding Zn-ribbon protein